MSQSAPGFRSGFGPKKKVILMIATGDTCRSPMAAAFLRKLLEDRRLGRDFDVRSAGVMTVTGLRASQEAVQILAAEGVDLQRHRSTQLTADMIRRAHLILGMSPLHVQHALRLNEDARAKTFLLKEYTQSDPKNSQITDPMGGTLEVFKRRFSEIRKACERLVELEFFTHAARQAAEARARAAAEAAAREASASPAAAAPARCARSRRRAPRARPRRTARRPVAARSSRKARRAKVRSARGKVLRTRMVKARGSRARKAAKAVRGSK